MAVNSKAQQVTASESEHQSGNSSKAWFFAVLIGVVGALINIIPLPILPEINLILGNAAFVFVAMHLLPRYTVLAGLITAVPIYYVLDYQWGFLIFGLEAWFISTMRCRGWYVLIADMAYWLVIGMPLTCIIIWLTDGGFDSADLFTVLKQGFNGLWYTSIACFLMFIFNEKLNIQWRHQSTAHRTLRAKLMYSLVFVTTAALFSATLFICHHFIQVSKSMVDKALVDSVEKTTNVIDLYIDKNQQGILLSGDWMQHVSNGYDKFISSRFMAMYPDIHSVFIADDSGQIVFSAGELAGLKQLPSTANIYKRSGVSSDALVYKFSEAGDVSTIINTVINAEGDGEKYSVEAVLNLSFASKLTVDKVNKVGIDILVVDSKNNIAYASPKLNLTTLAMFEPNFVDHDSDGRSLLAINQSNYIYQKSETLNDWTIYALVNEAALADNIKSEYLVVFVVLFFTLMFTAYFADQFGRRLIKPVDFIIAQLNKQHSDKMPASMSVSEEVKHLYEEIISNRNTLYSYQELLEEKVIERTQELNIANKKLEKLALYDGLTQVHNRHYLDNNFSLVQKSADRNMALMALIMIDLDYFKKLNDQFGHLTGDRCLIRVAQLVKKAFDRGSDMVVRFGGEEFIVVAPYITPSALREKLEQLRITIESESFVDENNHTINISASFGALIADASFSNDILQWIHIADDALYEAKDAGRNCVRIIDKVARVD